MLNTEEALRNSAEMKIQGKNLELEDDALYFYLFFY